MKVRPWDNTISKEDLEVYERADLADAGDWANVLLF